MIKPALDSALFTLAICISLLGMAQPDSVRYINGVHNHYKVEYHRSATFTQNINNQLKKPNYRQDTLSLTGLQMKAFHDSLTRYVQQLFPPQTWQGLPSGHRILLNLGILGSGQVAELLSLAIPSGVLLSGTEVERLEELLKSKRIIVTDSSRYTSINFIPLFFPVNPVK